MTIICLPKKNAKDNCVNMFSVIWILAAITLSIGSVLAQCPLAPTPVINPGGAVNYYLCAPPNDYGCTANDVSVWGFRVVDANDQPIQCMSCTGDIASAYIELKYMANAQTKYNVFFIFGLDKNNDGTITLTSDLATNEQYRVALTDIAKQNCEYTVKFPISWPCGNALYLVGPSASDSKCGGGGPVVHWDNNAPPSGQGMKEYDCSPRSKCDCFAPFTISLCQAKAVDFPICQGTVVTDDTFWTNGAKCSAGCTGSIIKSAGFDPNVPGTYAYTVRCTNPDNCYSEDVGYVTVNPLPIVSVNAQSACVGAAEAILTATTTGTVCASPALTYKWYKGTSTTALSDDAKYSGTATADLHIKNIVPADADSYKVEVTCPATGCSKSVTGTLTVNPLPVVSVSPQSACVGAAKATLTATTTGTVCASPALTYKWYKGTSTTALSDGAKYSGTATADLEIKNIVTADADSYKVEVACPATGCTNSNTGTLTVNPLPMVSVDSLSICTGAAEATLTATTTGTVCSSALTYKWYKGTSTIELLDDAKYSGTATANLKIKNIVSGDADSYRVEVTCSATGCTGTNSGVLTVQSGPTVVVGGPMTICVMDGAITLSGTVTNFQSAIWSIFTGNSYATIGSTSLIPDPADPSTSTATALLTPIKVTGYSVPVEVKLTADPKPPCTDPVDKTQAITIIQKPTIDIIVIQP